MNSNSKQKLCVGDLVDSGSGCGCWLGAGLRAEPEERSSFSIGMIVEQTVKGKYPVRVYFPDGRSAWFEEKKINLLARAKR